MKIWFSGHSSRVQAFSTLMTKIESLEIIGSSFISFFLFLFSTVRPINVKIVSKSHLIKSSFSSASSSSTNAKELDSKLPFVLSAGSKAEFQCESVGSRPAAQISWWLGSERFSTNIHDNINDDGNATISTIVFVPNIEDDGKLLTCRADNLPMPHTALKDERLLNILCKYLMMLLV